VKVLKQKAGHILDPELKDHDGRFRLSGVADIDLAEVSSAINQLRLLEEDVSVVKRITLSQLICM
jgi:hypothetical protein